MPIGPGAPNPSGFPGFHSHYGITATAGGGNANAAQMNGWLNTVTTVVTTGDSVMLPPGYAGEEITVINNGANSLNVFGYMNTAPGDIVTDTVSPPGSIVQGTAGVAVADRQRRRAFRARIAHACRRVGLRTHPRCDPPRRKGRGSLQRRCRGLPGCRLSRGGAQASSGRRDRLSRTRVGRPSAIARSRPRAAGVCLESHHHRHESGGHGARHWR